MLEFVRQTFTIAIVCLRFSSQGDITRFKRVSAVFEFALACSYLSLVYISLLHGQCVMLFGVVSRAFGQLDSGNKQGSYGAPLPKTKWCGPCQSAEKYARDESYLPLTIPSWRENVYAYYYIDTILLRLDGWCNGVKVALGNRGMTVEAARQCAKDRIECRAMVHM